MKEYNELREKNIDRGEENLYSLVKSCKKFYTYLYVETYITFGETLVQFYYYKIQ